MRRIHGRRATATRAIPCKSCVNSMSLNRASASNSPTAVCWPNPISSATNPPGVQRRKCRGNQPAINVQTIIARKQRLRRLIIAHLYRKRIAIALWHIGRIRDDEIEQLARYGCEQVTFVESARDQRRHSVPRSLAQLPAPPRRFPSRESRAAGSLLASATAIAPDPVPTSTMRSLAMR